jgi:sugar phosphate isomerase/epimerase
MARPVTLFTGQWADLPLEVLAAKAAGWGYDGLELACWGDHFEVDKALADEKYCEAKRKLLKKHGLEVYAISAHLVGQAVCDNIDGRHKSILPADVWGDGEPEGVRKRAAQKTWRQGRQWFYRQLYLALCLFFSPGFGGDDKGGV